MFLFIEGKNNCKKITVQFMEMTCPKDFPSLPTILTQDLQRLKSLE